MNRTRLRTILLATGAALAIAACSNPEQEKLQKGVSWAAARFRDTKRNPIAAIALGPYLEQNGPLTQYLSAAIPEKNDFPPFVDGRATLPWTVAIRLESSGRIFVEGFGKSLDKPTVAETVTVRMPGPPR